MRIAEIYKSTQGEGFLTGTDSTFVRTSGCNLRCWFCDTPYTSWSPEGDDLSVDEIVQEVSQYACDHVVITGGEPMLFAELIPLGEGTKIFPEDAREYSRQVQSLPDPQRQSLLPRAILAALNRFTATRSIQDVSATAHGLCQAEAERLESELSMVRYIAWAIPSIGFIGTVRGIGEALGQAHKAVEGDIAGVTQSLGVAFNSTFIALLISIILMFALHQLQLYQERLVQETETYLDQELIQHLQVSS